MWRRAILAVLLSSCGRTGYDVLELSPGSDADLGQLCSTDMDCPRCSRCTGTCTPEPISQLTLGHRSTCYIGANGARWCAGESNDGQLGLGDTETQPRPVRADDGEGWERIFLFYYGRAIGVRGGQFWEWGGGVGLEPVVSGPARQVQKAIGDLGLECFWEADGTAGGCSGANDEVWKSIDYSADHFCGVKQDGTLWCWGTNQSGDLGQAGLDEQQVVDIPTQVGDDDQWKAVGVGGNLDRGVSCALNAIGEIHCFGHGQLTGRNGEGGFAMAPIQDSDWDWIDVDWEHACAGKSDGSVFCWGSDTYGGFVAPGLQTALVPTRVPGTYDRWVMGGHHACGLEADRWRCFGWNEAGQLGVGNTNNDGALVDLCPQ